MVTMSKNAWVILLSVIVIGAGGAVFGHFVLEGMKMDRSAFAADKLRVLSYSSFVSSFGPGPELVQKFREETGVEVELVNIGDSGLLITKLKEDASIPVDVVLGLDRMALTEASNGLGWQPLADELFQSIRPELLAPSSQQFIPVMWAPLTFLFKKGTFKAQETLLDFFKSSSDSAVSLQDPRLSTPGLQFLFWQNQLGLDLAQLEPKQFRISSSWSQAYGVFKRDAAQAVFTYLTSIVFHWDQEKNESYDYLVLPQGHPYQVEMMAVSDRCRRCEDAQKFVAFLLRDENQKVLMEKNYMFPVTVGTPKSGSFARLPELPLLSYDGVEAFLNSKDQIAGQLLDRLK